MDRFEIHENICTELNATYEAKNKDYGNSFGELRKELGEKVILVRLGDKYKRLVQLLDNKEYTPKVAESIDDTLLDLANYAIMELVERQLDGVKKASTTSGGYLINGAAKPMFSSENVSEVLETLDEYQKEALRTANEKVNLINCALGLTGEAGEFADMIKKEIFQGHSRQRYGLMYELGDILWYIAVAANRLGVNLSAIANLNKVKLRKRYPDGFKPEDSINRGTCDDTEN